MDDYSVIVTAEFSRSLQEPASDKARAIAAWHANLDINRALMSEHIVKRGSLYALQSLPDMPIINLDLTPMGLGLVQLDALPSAVKACVLIGCSDTLLYQEYKPRCRIARLCNISQCVLRSFHEIRVDTIDHSNVILADCILALCGSSNQISYSHVQIRHWHAVRGNTSYIRSVKCSSVSFLDCVALPIVLLSVDSSQLVFKNITAPVLGSKILIHVAYESEVLLENCSDLEVSIEAASNARIIINSCSNLKLKLYECHSCDIVISDTIINGLNNEIYFERSNDDIRLHIENTGQLRIVLQDELTGDNYLRADACNTLTLATAYMHPDSSPPFNNIQIAPGIRIGRS